MYRFIRIVGVKAVGPLFHGSNLCHNERPCGKDVRSPLMTGLSVVFLLVIGARLVDHLFIFANPHNAEHVCRYKSLYEVICNALLLVHINCYKEFWNYFLCSFRSPGIGFPCTHRNATQSKFFLQLKFYSEVYTTL
jgi:hypothetical protein